MNAFIGIITYLLYIALFMGLIKPALAIPWSKKPTRSKVFGLWLVSIVSVSLLSSVIEDKSYESESKIKTATTQIQEGNYSDAIVTLSQIEESDSLFYQAKQLSEKADSLNNLTEEEKEFALELKIEQDREEEIKALLEQLKREVASVQKGIDFSTYRGSMDALQIEIVLFGVYAKLISEGINSNNPEIKELARRLKNIVLKMQAKEFPAMRKEYTKLSSSLLWEHDIEVFTTGSRNNNLNFTGGIFITNKNIKAFQEQLKDSPKLFRFKQIRYRWYSGEDEYTYYSTYDGTDEDLVFFQK